jgi:hypothetical protein
MNLKICLFALFFFTYQIFPQANQNQISIKVAQNGEAEWRFNLEWNSNFQPTDGIDVDLPETIMLIPVSIKINDGNLWLQNSAVIPEQDSVISWQSTPGSIILLFKSGLVRNGDQLTLLFNGSFLQKKSGGNIIQVRDVVWQSGTIETSDVVQATGTLPVISNIEEK